MNGMSTHFYSVVKSCIVALLLFLVFYGKAISVHAQNNFSCGYCIGNSDPYTPIGQCIFNRTLPQCSDAMDINNDGGLDAGDLSACARCRAVTATSTSFPTSTIMPTSTINPTLPVTPTREPTLTSTPAVATPTATLTPTSMLTPTGTTPTPQSTITGAPAPCEKKSRGDADCKTDRDNKSVTILDYAIWYSEFIKDCTSGNSAKCGSDVDGDGDSMDANFNYAGTSHISTDDKVTIFDYAVWIQGFTVENNQ